MANNKVVLGNEVLIDLTDSTVNPNVLLAGYKAYDASGNAITGEFSPSYHITLTQAQYNQLSQTEKMADENFFYITDAVVVGADIDDTTTSTTKVWSSSKVNTELGNKANTSSLATVATSGSYADLSNKPTIPTALSQLTDDTTHRVVTDTEKSTWNSKASSSDLSTLSTTVTNNNTAQNNKHKVTSKQVATTGWTSDTTSQSGTTLYKKTITLSHVYVTSPIVDIGASGVLPTTAQQEAYDLLQYVTINGTTLTLYGSAIPSTAYYINITGAD